MHFVIINGPNLNLLGQREKDIYGSQTFESYFEQLKAVFPEHRIDYFQSNVEGELINFIQSVGFSADGILLNAGGYTHTSVAIGDAVKAITTPVVEVHISNIYARESFRHTSFISPNAKGCIIGMGLNGYRLAIESFLL
ncbi:MAG TPA: type II 3-dehydroquinate dehydratase [Bacteroidia bacterium]|nr:type II 3-dehydroquinate dehydratase [Bacteroidia bacterium]HRH08280.1 type II 3-dehydroquinate dehydratase [Bacteroidia bacterium]HRH64410.1 type II 3-dehydroquinate dehydratase [Bacteroidia bacterium]